MATLAKRTAILNIKTLRFIVCLSWIGLASCTGGNKKAEVPYYADATFTPVWQPEKAQLDSMHTISPFGFTNQFDQPVSNQTLAGSVYLADFFFTSCPSICPKLTHTMKLVFQRFKSNKKVLFLSHSVTPEIDNTAKLYQYASKNKVLSRQWHFLTGDKAAIYSLARKSYFIEEETGLSKTTGQFLHTEKFVLIDQKGYIRGIYNGTLEAEVPRIIQDIEALL